MKKYNLQHPKLSIITVNYNNNLGLELTLESILNQGFEDYELIIIDGGSSDESVKTIQTYEQSVDYWLSESDSGIYEAMNKGILQAKGEYLFFLNSGDRLCSSEVLANVFHNQRDVDFFYGNYTVYNNSKSFKAPDRLNFSDFWFKSILCHQTVFIKKELFTEYGLYNESLKVAADWEFFVKVVFLFNVTYEYVDVDVSEIDLFGLSASEKGQSISYKERQLLMDKYFSGFKLDYELLHYYKSQRFIRLMHWIVQHVRQVKHFFRS